MQAPAKRLVFFSFCVSLLRLGFFFCVLFSGLVWSLVLCWSPGALFDLVSGWAVCVEASGVPLRGACSATVAALFSWPARKTCRFFTFLEFAQNSQSSRGPPS